MRWSAGHGPTSCPDLDMTENVWATGTGTGTGNQQYQNIRELKDAILLACRRYVKASVVNRLGISSHTDSGTDYYMNLLFFV